MPAGGMTADVEPLGVAAEALGIAVDPSDGAAHLLGHDHQIAAGFQHVVEVEYDVMRARIDEHLGRICVVQSEARAPGAAMNEDAHGSVRDSGGEYVERLDRRWPGGETLGRAEPFAGELAVAGATLEDVVAIGGVDELVIGVIEILLVHVEPNQRALDAWRWRRPLRQCRCSRAEDGGGGGGGDERAPRDFLARRFPA